jgi:type IV secretory pathway VirB10-like protein
MRSTALLSIAAIALTATSWAQDEPHVVPKNPVPQRQQPNVDPSSDYNVSSGTKIPLTLTQGITSKTAKEGDPVYAQTAFPVTQNNRIVIPAGTYVQGVVRRVVRPGRVKGRAELQMSFTSMIFPNGYTVLIPATVEGVPGSQSMSTKGTEGTIQGDSSKGKDAATIARAAGVGAGIGAIAGNGKDAGIGGAAGGVLGLATVLLTRGPEIQLNPGSSIEMILERGLTLEGGQLRRQ